jgi:hypothetical protein
LAILQNRIIVVSKNDYSCGGGERAVGAARKEGGNRKVLRVGQAHHGLPGKQLLLLWRFHKVRVEGFAREGKPTLALLEESNHCVL